MRRRGADRRGPRYGRDLVVAGLGRAQPAVTGFCRVVVGLTVVAITSGALGGCSAIAVRGPRTSSSGSAGTAPATREVVCDATYVPPVILVPFAISAVYGFAKVSGCK